MPSCTSLKAEKVTGSAFAVHIQDVPNADYLRLRKQVVVCS